MKKITLITCLTLIGNLCVLAQIKKGAFLFGPAVNYNNQKIKNNNGLTIETTTQRNFTSNLKLGYFITDKVVIGLLATSDNYLKRVKTETNSSETETNSKTNVYGIGLFGRAYKIFGEGKFGFFGELEGTYEFGKSESSQKTNPPFGNSVNYGETEIDGFMVGLRPGVFYLITEKIGLEISMGNVFFRSTYSGNYYSTSQLNADFGFNTFFLGTKFYFGGK